MVRRAHCPAFAPGLLASWAEPIVPVCNLQQKGSLCTDIHKPAFQMDIQQPGVFLTVQSAALSGEQALRCARSWPPSHRRARCRPHTAHEVAVTFC